MLKQKRPRDTQAVARLHTVERGWTLTAPANRRSFRVRTNSAAGGDTRSVKNYETGGRREQTGLRSAQVVGGYSMGSRRLFKQKDA
eukprot:7999525-Pyramimonas_sp.AAC.1